MPEIQTSFYYDPYRQGFDTNEWRLLLGTTNLDANRLEVIGGAISHYADILKGSVTFSLKAPVAPTGMNCLIGLYAPSRGSFIVFNFSGDLTASVSNGSNTTNSSEISWNSAWTGVATTFRIDWEAGLVKFFICGVRVATISGDYIPPGPLSLYIFDNSSVPMSVGSIEVRGAQSVFMHLRTSDTAAPAEPAGSMIATQDVTVTDVPTIKIPILVPSVSDQVTITEAVGTPAVTVKPSVSDNVTITENKTLTVI